ncbi:flippase [Vibrio harveyi]|uniref:flippase n=1 Tax=Vibrio harveyi TaxID=669 RepID=UPI002380B4E7|nr:flippase [Vibrio harveyi]
MSKIFSNSIFSILDQLLSLISSLGLSIIFARYLGAESLGQYSLALSVTGLLAIFSNFGINTIVNREVAKSTNKANIYISNSVFIKLFISAPVMLILTGGVLYTLSYGYNTSIIICLAALLSIFNNLMVSLTSSLTSLHRTDLVFKVNICYKISTFFIACVLIYLGFDLLLIIVGFILVSIFLCLYSFFQVKNVLPSLTLKYNLNFCKVLIITSLPLIFASAAEYISLKIDTIFIGYFYDEHSVGIYSAAYNIFLGLTLIPLALTKVYFPNFVNLMSKDLNLAKALFKKYTLIYTVYASVSSLILFFFSGALVEYIYGASFYDSKLVLKFLSFAIFVLVLNRLFNYTLLAMKYNKYYFYITLIGMIFNVILNLMSIPLYGILAAVISTIITEFIVMILGGSKLIIIFRQRNKILERT